jgi:hypothetical protein
MIARTRPHHCTRTLCGAPRGPAARGAARRARAAAGPARPARRARHDPRKRGGWQTPHPRPAPRGRGRGAAPRACPLAHAGGAWRPIRFGAELLSPASFHPVPPPVPPPVCRAPGNPMRYKPAPRIRPRPPQRPRRGARRRRAGRAALVCRGLSRRGVLAQRSNSHPRAPPPPPPPPAPARGRRQQQQRRGAGARPCRAVRRRAAGRAPARPYPVSPPGLHGRALARPRLHCQGPGSLWGAPAPSPVYTPARRAAPTAAALGGPRLAPPLKTPGDPFGRGHRPNNDATPPHAAWRCCPPFLHPAGANPRACPSGRRRRPSGVARRARGRQNRRCPPARPRPIAPARPPAPSPPRARRAERAAAARARPHQPLPLALRTHAAAPRCRPSTRDPLRTPLDPWAPRPPRQPRSPTTAPAPFPHHRAVLPPTRHAPRRARAPARPPPATTLGAGGAAGPPRPAPRPRASSPRRIALPMPASPTPIDPGPAPRPARGPQQPIPELSRTARPPPRPKPSVMPTPPCHGPHWVTLTALTLPGVQPEQNDGSADTGAAPGAAAPRDAQGGAAGRRRKGPAMGCRGPAEPGASLPRGAGSAVAAAGGASCAPAVRDRAGGPPRARRAPAQGAAARDARGARCWNGCRWGWGPLPAGGPRGGGAKSVKPRAPPAGRCRRARRGVGCRGPAPRRVRRGAGVLGAVPRGTPSRGGLCGAGEGEGEASGGGLDS